MSTVPMPIHAICGPAPKPSAPVSSVGLLKSKSPWLRKDNVFLGVFLKNAVLHFRGCVQIRVLAGLIHCNGYIIRPSSTYYPLYSPGNHPGLSISPLDTGLQDSEFDQYLAPLRDSEQIHFHFISKGPSGVTQGSDIGSKCKDQGCLHVDLGYEDTRQLNRLVSKDWKDLSSLVLLKSLESFSVPLINYWTAPLPLFGVTPQVIEGFETVSDGNHFLPPATYRDIAWEVVTQPGSIVLVCGQSNTGKSTLCRFLINYMLNRYSSVCYLECDPGQPEFTVPEVLSLHIITEPILGPPYTHHKKPNKAYYYGDKTPREDPEYYLRLIQSLCKYFQETVRSGNADMSLVVNTCGWISNMGIQLYLDIVRTLTPTHIVRTYSHTFVNIAEDLPPLTSEFLSTAPGLYRTTDMSPFTGTEEETPPTADLSLTPDMDDVIMYASSDEALELSDDSSNDDQILSTSSSSEDDDVLDSSKGTTPSLTPEVVGQLHSDKEKRQLKRKKKKRKLRMAAAKLSVQRERRIKKKNIVVLYTGDIDRWMSIPPYKLFNLKTPVVIKKRSKVVRRLSYISYFSGLLPEALEVARQYNLPDPYGNLMCYAPPLEIPWRDVAVHILHRNVPNSQSLYALNGKVVALGWVDPQEIVERDSAHPDLVRFLKSETPFIEWIGLGVMRGIDVEQKLFFVSTPDCSPTHYLSSVNTIALGNPHRMDFFSAKTNPDQQEQPYVLKGFQSLLGMYSWKQS